MIKYLAEVRRMEKFFDGFEVRYAPRLDNCDADHLAWIASSTAPTPPDVIVEKLSKPSVKAVKSSEGAVGQDLMVLHEPKLKPVYDWIQPIKMFLENRLPSDDNTKVKHIA
jgi:hypothetical protein